MQQGGMLGDTKKAVLIQKEEMPQQHKSSLRPRRFIYFPLTSHKFLKAAAFNLSQRIGLCAQSGRVKTKRLN